MVHHNLLITPYQIAEPGNTRPPAHTCELYLQQHGTNIVKDRKKQMTPQHTHCHYRSCYMLVPCIYSMCIFLPSSFQFISYMPETKQNRKPKFMEISVLVQPVPNRTCSIRRKYFLVIAIYFRTYSRRIYVRVYLQAQPHIFWHDHVPLPQTVTKLIQMPFSSIYSQCSVIHENVHFCSVRKKQLKKPVSSGFASNSFTCRFSVKKFVFLDTQKTEAKMNSFDSTRS